MGLWDRIRSKLFTKAASSSSNDVEQPEMITVYDKFGRTLLVPKQEWRQNVLPGQIEEAWNDPAALYQAIVMALNDGFYIEVLAASERLLQIDDDQERSHVVRGIVLMKTGDLDGSKKILTKYIDEHGATGTVLTNLAKVYAERDESERAELTLWDGLKLDPNQENGLSWWGAIHEERLGQQGFIDSMSKAATIPGSWRPQLWLARKSLEQDRPEEAIRHYEAILKVAADHGDVLMQISGDLGSHGCLDEILTLILPVYDPEKHDVQTGLNILQAYMEKGDYILGKQLLQRMYALNRPDIRDRLHYYAAEFEKLKDAAEPLPPASDQQGTPVG